MSDKPLTEEELIKVIEGQMKKGAARLKVEFSDQLEEGEKREVYHHGRCDVGSPWALGTVTNCDAIDVNGEEDTCQ